MREKTQCIRAQPGVMARPGNERASRSTQSHGPAEVGWALAQWRNPRAAPLLHLARPALPRRIASCAAALGAARGLRLLGRSPAHLGRASEVLWLLLVVRSSLIAPPACGPRPPPRRR